MSSPTGPTPKPDNDIKIIAQTSRVTDVDTEVVTQIHVPEDGGWGWVIVATSFISVVLLDGIVYTFGSLFAAIRDDLQVEESLVALINSVTFAMYFMLAPIASGIINKYGFRECTMVGSVICSFSLLCTYFATGYAAIILFYGFLNGFGACLINMASSLVVGFYFEKLRSIVLSVSASGSSVGCMIMYSVNSYLVRKAGWKNTTLLHSGMLGVIFFLGMNYKPVLPLIVTPPLPEATYSARDLKVDQTSIQRLLKTASNPKFPSVASVVRQSMIRGTSETSVKKSIASKTSQPGTSNDIIKVTIAGKSESITQRQLERVQSLASDYKDHRMEITLKIEPPKKRGFWARLCNWKENAREARPMYRDDVFYGGSVEKLRIYKESVQSTSKDRFPIEYHMAVTRAALAEDIHEKHKLCPIAMRRVFASMIDPSLLKRCSFLMLCSSSFFVYMGLLIPYTFLEERNKQQGIAKEHCSRIISFIALSNFIGRLTIGFLAYKVSPLLLYITSVSISGLGTMALNLSFSVYYQYACAGIFGFFSASLVSMRSVIIVKLFGLENLTNGTGLALMFQGIGSLISTPLSSVLKSRFGYAMSFYIAGSFLVTSGVIMTITRFIVRNEIK